MPGLVTLPRSSSVEECLAVIERDGGVIIEDLFDHATIDGLNADMKPALESVSVGTDPYFAGIQTRRVGACFAHSPVYMTAIASNPLYYGIAQKILCKPITCWLGEDKTTINPDMMIGVTQLIQIGPGQGAQPLHRVRYCFIRCLCENFS
jgi:hypothetical protein